MGLLRWGLIRAIGRMGHGQFGQRVSDSFNEQTDCVVVGFQEEGGEGSREHVDGFDLQMMFSISCCMVGRSMIDAVL